MLKFDTHTHIGIRPDVLFMAEDLLARMDEAGVDAALVFPMILNLELWPPRYNPFAGNDYMAAAQRTYPDRIVGLAAIHPWLRTLTEFDIGKVSGHPSVRELFKVPGFEQWDDDALRAIQSTNPAGDEMERAILELGLSGLKIHSVLQGTAVNNPIAMLPTFDVLADCQREVNRPLVVVIHCMSDGPLNTPEQIGWLAGRYTNLTFIMAHMGTLWGSASAVGVAEEHPNVILDFTWVPNTGIMKGAVERVGASRITAGSDEPFGTFEGKEALLEIAVPDEADRELILGKNIADLLEFAPGR